jgi:hypothetical protein
MGEMKAVSPMRVRPGEFTRPFIDVGGSLESGSRKGVDISQWFLANVGELCWKVNEEKELKE